MATSYRVVKYDGYIMDGEKRTNSERMRDAIRQQRQRRRQRRQRQRVGKEMARKAASVSCVVRRASCVVRVVWWAWGVKCAASRRVLIVSELANIPEY